MRMFFTALVTMCVLSTLAYPQSFIPKEKQSVHYKVQPVFEQICGLKGDYSGYMKERLDAITDMWLLPAPIANPMLVNMFHMRDKEHDPSTWEWSKSLAFLLPWSGEFVGKHLLAAQLVCRMTNSPELKRSIDSVIHDFISTQAPDGYLGPFPDSLRFASNNWDYWGHYHAFLALLTYYDDTGCESALKAACKAADLIGRVLPQNKFITCEMNNAILHGMIHLYLRSGEPGYLKTAQWVVDQWDYPDPGSLKYLTLALEGKPVVEFPAHRWESAHTWQGIAEMYLLTGDEKYLKAFSHIWWDVLQGDRHNTGGWTSGEGVQNNPYHQGAIETCCTVAWIAMTIDMLRLTGNPMIADELELSTWNGSIGGMDPSGRWWSYNTPMDGFRRSSTHDITFQARAGSPELNCCSVNAPRGLGMIHQWAVMKGKDSVILNWFGPGAFTVPLDNGNSLIIRQDTDYPRSGVIRLMVGVTLPLQTTLKVRIPSWSAKTIVSVNNVPVKDVKPGTYLELSRLWQNGDIIDLSLDMSSHYWVGDRECKGKVSIYTGPLLLAWDQRFNSGAPDALPTLDAAALSLVPIVVLDYPKPIVVYKVKAKDGSSVILCDYATAGMTGNTYRSWLPIEGVKDVGKSVWTVR